MSFIRMTQEGRYVDIPDGSTHYLFDNGNDIGGWSYGQFAAVIGTLVDELPSDHDGIKAAFEGYFGGWNEDYRGGVAPPERAEIFCQCVDRRFEEVELTDDLHAEVREWMEDNGPYLRECEYCGKEFRPALDTGEPYHCHDDECEKQAWADSMDITVEQLEVLNRLQDEDRQEEWAERYEEMKATASSNASKSGGSE